MADQDDSMAKKPDSIAIERVGTALYSPANDREVVQRVVADGNLTPFRIASRVALGPTHPDDLDLNPE